MKAKRVSNEVEEYIRENLLLADGKLIRKVAVNKQFLAGEEAGTLSLREGYRYINILGRKLKSHRVVFWIWHGYWPDIIDHIDQNKLNNSPSNLRDSCKALNSFNQPSKQIRAEGLPTGVHRHRDKFQAQISFRCKSTCLGTFNSVEEALVAYNIAREKRMAVLIKESTFRMQLRSDRIA